MYFSLVHMSAFSSRFLVKKGTNLYWSILATRTQTSASVLNLNSTFNFHDSVNKVQVVTMSSQPSLIRPKIFVSRAIDSKTEGLLKEKFDIECWEKDEPPPRDKYLSAVHGKDAIFCMIPDKIDQELLDVAGSSLKVVSTMSVGYDHIDVVACKARNIKVGNTPGVLTKATAELAVALLLATSRRLKEGMQSVVDGTWGTWKPFWLCGNGLDGSTLGIVGMGRIGTTIAQCLKPFGVENILHWGGRKRKEFDDQVGAQWVSFDELLTRSDFVIACCSFNAETNELFDVSAFKKMKSNSIFINISRGGVVKQDDLFLALKEGYIGAAGLDVTTPEPLPPSSPLLNLPNCVILPHIGSATNQSRQAMAWLAAQNAIAAVNGKKMPSEVV